MSTVPLRSAGSAPSSARSSISDIPMMTPPESTLAPYDPVVQLSDAHESSRSNSFDDDDLLDAEDPLSRAFADATEFEPFSKLEYAFISVSCLGVVLIPSLFLLVMKLVTNLPSATLLTTGVIDLALMLHKTEFDGILAQNMGMCIHQIPGMELNAIDG